MENSKENMHFYIRAERVKNLPIKGKSNIISHLNLVPKQSVKTNVDWNVRVLT